jgi:ATP-dependent RNA circularization protein (DNA/RNA ligase family)
MSEKYKYPRTPHMPFSPGATKDDKTLPTLEYFNGKNVVLTEKMDGENTTLYPDYIHARSLDSKDHESRHWVKGLWGNIKHEIPNGWRICGENLYAKHSISYNSLQSFFMVFSVWDEYNNCLSWDDTQLFCETLNLITVPVLYKGVFDEEKIKQIINQLNLNEQEGVVMRTSEAFKYTSFGQCLAKWVRSNHVQENSKHWFQSKVIPNIMCA